MVKISAINHSTVVSAEDFAKMCAAVAEQCNAELAAAWGTQQVEIGMVASDSNALPAVAVRTAQTPLLDAPAASLVLEPVGAWLLILLDDTTQAGALGYHDLLDGAATVPIAYVFAKTCLDYNTSVSVCVSHEVLEMMVDPWIDAADQTGNAEFTAMEICDPCEADALGYSKLGVIVSDFVTPAWFRAGAKGPYDEMGHLNAPLALAAGGYKSTYSASAAAWNQVTDMRRLAARAMPTEYSRRGRRHAAHRAFNQKD